MKKFSNKLCKPIFLIIFLLAIIAGVFFGVDYWFFSGEWLNGDSWVSIIICLISSGATLILGYISYWQNQRQREDNIKAQETIKQNATKEAQNLQRQRKLEVLVKNFDKYRDKLETIHAEMQKFDNHSAIYKISKNIIESAQCNTSSEEIEKKINDSNELMERMIILLNFIENTIVFRYNKYFIDETETLVLKIVGMRHEIENFSYKYLKLALEKDDKIKKEKYTKLKDDYLSLYNRLIEFEAAWQNYLMKIIERFEILEYNGNPEEIILMMNESYIKIQDLRTRVIKLEQEHKEIKNSDLSI